MASNNKINAQSEASLKSSDQGSSNVSENAAPVASQSGSNDSEVHSSDHHYHLYCQDSTDGAKQITTTFCKPDEKMSDRRFRKSVSADVNDHHPKQEPKATDNSSLRTRCCRLGTIHSGSMLTTSAMALIMLLTGPTTNVLVGVGCSSSPMLLSRQMGSSNHRVSGSGIGSTSHLASSDAAAARHLFQTTDSSLHKDPANFRHFSGTSVLTRLRRPTTVNRMIPQQDRGSEMDPLRLSNGFAVVDNHTSGRVRRHTALANTRTGERDVETIVAPLINTAEGINGNADASSEVVSPGDQVPLPVHVPIQLSIGRNLMDLPENDKTTHPEFVGRFAARQRIYDTFRDASRRFAAVSIRDPVKLMLSLQGLITDIAWSMLEELKNETNDPAIRQMMPKILKEIELDGLPLMSIAQVSD